MPTGRGHSNSTWMKCAQSSDWRRKNGVLSFEEKLKWWNGLPADYGWQHPCHCQCAPFLILCILTLLGSPSHQPTQAPSSWCCLLTALTFTTCHSAYCNMLCTYKVSHLAILANHKPANRSLPHTRVPHLIQVNCIFHVCTPAFKGVAWPPYRPSMLTVRGVWKKRDNAMFVWFL